MFYAAEDGAKVFATIKKKSRPSDVAGGHKHISRRFENKKKKNNTYYVCYACTHNTPVARQKSTRNNNDDNIIRAAGHCNSIVLLYTVLPDASVDDITRKYSRRSRSIFFFHFSGPR